jgi:hypothetical protein
VAERFLRAVGFLDADGEETILVTAVFLFITGILAMLWLTPDLARGLHSMHVGGW